MNSQHLYLLYILKVNSMTSFILWMFLHRLVHLKAQMVSECKSSETFTVSASWMWMEEGDGKEKADAFCLCMHIKTAMLLGWKRGIGWAKSCWPLQPRYRSGNDTCLLNYLLMYLDKDAWSKCHTSHSAHTLKRKEYLTESKPHKLDSVTIIVLHTLWTPMGSLGLSGKGSGPGLKSDHWAITTNVLLSRKLMISLT